MRSVVVAATLLLLVADTRADPAPRTFEGLSQPMIGAKTKLPGDLWLAGVTRKYITSDGDFFIYKVNAKGVTMVLHESHTRLYQGGWIDSHTYVGLETRNDEDPFVIRTYTDGSAAKVYTIPVSAFAAAKPDSPLNEGSLYFAGSQIWLEQCVSLDAMMSCSRKAQLRVDVASPRPEPLPAGARDAQSLATPPAVPTPARAKVELGTKSGAQIVRCSLGAKKSTVEPATSGNRVTGVSWIHATPPVYAISLVDDSTRWTGYQVYRACDKLMLTDYVWLDAHAWAEITDENEGELATWTLFVDGSPVARVLAAVSQLHGVARAPGASVAPTSDAQVTRDATH